MGPVPVSTNGSGKKGIAKLNYNRQYEDMEVRDAVVGREHGISQAEKSRINEVAEAVHNESERTTQTQDSLQKLRQQQQPPGLAVCWERFLPFRSIKVLLVENDDSTRYVVSALLRNCSYEGL